MKSYYLYGMHPVLSAINSKRRNIFSVLCNKKVFEEYSEKIKNYNHKIVDNNTISNLVGRDASHQGICANVSPLKLIDIREIDFSDKKNEKIAILDQVTDVHNVGAIIRSALFFGINTIIMQKDSSPEESPAMAKSSSGAIEYINFCKVTNISSSIEYLKENGFWILGLDSNQKQKIDSKILSGKIAVVLGSEGFGIRKLVKSKCDYLMSIDSKIENPNISLSIDSLNVSNAAAIIFHIISNL